MASRSSQYAAKPAITRTGVSADSARTLADPLAHLGARHGRQSAVGRRWMVSTPNSWATLEGARVLSEGGTAVDAAITVSAILMVAVPHQTSPGGDAFWLIKPRDATPVALNASGRSGGQADAARIREQGHKLMPERDAVSVTVPGVIDGWHAAAERYASCPLIDLIAPAVRFAVEGLPVTPYLARQFREADDMLAGRPESDRLYRPLGSPVRVGQLLQLPELADSLIAAAESRDTYATGVQAQAIVEAVQAEGGHLEPSDLARHRSDWMETIHGALKPPQGPEGWVLHELGANSQGWLAIFMLELARRLGGEACGPARGKALVEAAKAAVVLRSAVLADADSLAQPVTDFLDLPYLERAAAALSDRPPTSASDVARALGMPLALDTPSDGDTVHFAIVDGAGTAVSCIQSLYYDFGSGIVPPGMGFALQNRGACFTLRPGHPNVVAPHKRPMHTLSPAVAERADGSLAAVLGAMGGDAQTQIHAQILDALAGDVDPALATSAPRWFVRPVAGSFEVLVEDRYAFGSDLESPNHNVRRVRPFDELMGHAQVILRTEDGTLLGAADPRSDGLAAGY